jgi:dTMP kinase
MIPNPSKGKFIVFEGIDGCGKSTQLKRTFAWLSFLKKPVFKTKEPNKNGFWGSRIYEELKNPDGIHKKDPFGFQTWYACDSKQNMRNEVIPRLQSGCYVLSDRFRPSMCYGASNSEEIPTLMEMNQRIMGEHFIWPDLILFFDVYVDIAFARLEKKGDKKDAFERKANLAKVAERYKDFFEFFGKNFIRIDGNSEEERVFVAVKKQIENLLNISIS